jgi:hypothetical protein
LLAGTGSFAANVTPATPLEFPTYSVVVPHADLTEDTEVTTVSYKTWHMVGPLGDALFFFDDTIDVNITNHYRVHASSNYVHEYSPFQPLQDLVDDLTALGGGDAPLTVDLAWTIFGPTIRIQQRLPSDYVANGFDWASEYLLDLSIRPATGDFVKDFQMPLTALNFLQVPMGTVWWWYYGFLGIQNWQWPLLGSGKVGAFDGTREGLRWNYGRLPRTWMLRRAVTRDPAQQPFFYDPPDWAAGVIEDRPLEKEFYEAAPLPTQQEANTLLPVKNVLFKSAIGLMGQFAEVNATPGTFYDFLTRLSAWAKYERLQTSVAGFEDYSKGSPGQANYYPLRRNEILGIDPLPGDENLGDNVLPIEIEHFNSLASVVNGLEGTIQRVLPMQYVDQFVVPGYADGVLVSLGMGDGAGRGFGTNNTTGGPMRIRPRAQWASWDAVAFPDTEGLLEGLGITVLTQADFPSPWGSLTTTNMAWVGQYALDGGGSVFTTFPFESRPGHPEDVQPLLDTWLFQYFSGYEDGGYAGDRAGFDGYFGNYRWIDITNGQLLCQKLGIPFLLNELVVPGELLIADGGVFELDRGANTTTDSSGEFLVGARLFGWTNDVNGPWVYDVDAVSARGNFVVRAETPITENMWWLANDQHGGNIGGSDFDWVMWAMNFGDLMPRLYDDLTWGQNLQGVQKIRGNTSYLYRRYGAPPAKAMIWGVNHAGWAGPYMDTCEKAFAYASGGAIILPRSADTDNDGARHVIDLSANENVISTPLEYAEGKIFPVVKP